MNALLVIALLGQVDLKEFTSTDWVTYTNATETRAGQKIQLHVDVGLSFFEDGVFWISSKEEHATDGLSWRAIRGTYRIDRSREVEDIVVLVMRGSDEFRRTDGEKWTGGALPGDRQPTGTFLIGLENGAVPKGKLQYESEAARIFPEAWSRKNIITGVKWSDQGKQILEGIIQDAAPGYFSHLKGRPKERTLSDYQALTKCEWWSEPYMVTFRPKVGDKPPAVWILEVAKETDGFKSVKKGTYEITGIADGSLQAILRFPDERPPVGNVVKMSFPGAKLDDQLDLVTVEAYHIDAKGAKTTIFNQQNLKEKIFDDPIAKRTTGVVRTMRLSRDQFDATWKDVLPLGYKPNSDPSRPVVSQPEVTNLPKVDWPPAELTKAGLCADHWLYEWDGRKLMLEFLPGDGKKGERFCNVKVIYKFDQFALFGQCELLPGDEVNRGMKFTFNRTFSNYKNTWDKDYKTSWEIRKDSPSTTPSQMKIQAIRQAEGIEVTLMECTSVGNSWQAFLGWKVGKPVVFRRVKGSIPEVPEF